MDEMNNADVEILKFNNLLETIAKLVEAKAACSRTSKHTTRQTHKRWPEPYIGSP